MAKNDAAAAAAKAKKQKIVLIAGGVLLLGLGAIQGPKLLGGSKAAVPPPAAAAAANPSVAAGTVTTPGGTTATAVKVSGSRPTAILAGVSIQGSGAPVADTGQLLMFSLFEAKDPFVPQTSDELSGTTEPTATPTLSDTQPGTTGADGVTSSSAGASTAPPKEAPAPTTNATIVMNGKAYPLVVKESFPKADPLFVLVSLKPKLAKVGVAGGSFADAKTIPLVQGKKVTLVNEATGARYVLKLVYTGSAPEQTESFTQAQK